MSRAPFRRCTARLATATLAVVAAATSLVGCSASKPTGHTSSSQIVIGFSRPEQSLTGVVAVGHSGLTGYNTSLDGWGGLANSWATGSNPAVRSIVSRMTASYPKLRGRTANFAAPGATAAMLGIQAVNALAENSRPALIIVQIVGNDIHCNGSDPANYARVGQQVHDALETLHALSKQTPILMVGPLGNSAQEAQALAGTHAAVAAHSRGQCALFTGAGKVNADGVATLGTITDGYWQQMARACAAVPRCSTDHGVAAAFRIGPADLLPSDWKHLSVSGQARFAAALWPQVKPLLQ